MFSQKKTPLSIYLVVLWLFLTCQGADPIAAYGDECPQLKHSSIFYESIDKNRWNGVTKGQAGGYEIKCSNIGISFATPQLLYVIDLKDTLSCRMVNKGAAAIFSPTLQNATPGQALRIPESALAGSLFQVLDAVVKGMTDDQVACIGQIGPDNTSFVAITFADTARGQIMNVSSSRGHLSTDNVIDFPTDHPEDALQWPHLTRVMDFLGGTVVAIGPRGMVAADSSGSLQATITDYDLGSILRFSVCNEDEFNRRVEKIKQSLSSGFFSGRYDDAVSRLVVASSTTIDSIPMLYCGELK